MTKDLFDSENQHGASEAEERQLSLLELKLLERAEKKLEELQQRAIESHAAKTKEVLTEIVQSALFESGLLEKVVQRTVEKKLKEAGDSRGGPGQEGSQAQKEIEALVKRELQAALAGESVKVMIDDKFRAITLYLKSDVIPKAVGQALKSQRLPV